MAPSKGVGPLAALRASVPFFQKTLKDLITGMRANKHREHAYIADALVEIRNEVKSPDIRTKAIAVEKLAYLHMLGYDMSWAAFHVVEAMGSKRVRFKHIGYQAAAASFSPTTDVLLLVPNLLKKDIASPVASEAGLALGCLANIITPELAATLVSDVFAVLSSPKAYLRKKAVLTLYKCFLNYPDSLRPSFARLTEHLEDEDPMVVSAVVTVLCELAMHNPKTYLPLAPTFYKLLNSSTNNWMTIKLVKLFGALTPLEPRLGKKLVTPVTNLIQTTHAKSLLYECIRTVTLGMLDHEELVGLCITKLGEEFVSGDDPNLKFLGLEALLPLIETHPKEVAHYRPAMFKCLDEDDPTIQTASLALIKGLITRKSLADTVQRLMLKMRPASHELREDLVSTVLAMCGRDRYELVTDFVWYAHVLGELVRVPATSFGREIGRQMIDVAVRVEGVRPEMVRVSRRLLVDPLLLEDRPENVSTADSLAAAAWVTGEYAHFASDLREVLEAFLQPNVDRLLPQVQAMYLQALTKVFIKAGTPAPPAPEAADAEVDIREPCDAATMLELKELLQAHVGRRTLSVHLEVRERACQLQAILGAADAAHTSGGDEGLMAFVRTMSAGYAEPLVPVSAKAQKKVPVPEGLDLDAPLGPDFEVPKPAAKRHKADNEGVAGDASALLTQKTAEEMQRAEEEARQQMAAYRQKTSQFYLGQPPKEGERDGDEAGGSGASPTLPEEQEREKKQERKARPDPGALLGLPVPANIKAGRTMTVLRGDDDDDNEEESPVAAGHEPLIKPEVAASAQHSNLGDLDLTAPLNEQEALPAVSAYPRGYSRGGSAASPPMASAQAAEREGNGGERSHRRHRRHRREGEKGDGEEPERRHRRHRREGEKGDGEERKHRRRREKGEKSEPAGAQA